MGAAAARARQRGGATVVGVLIAVGVAVVLGALAVKTIGTASKEKGDRVAQCIEVGCREITQNLPPRSGRSLHERLTAAGVEPSKNVEDRRDWTSLGYDALGNAYHRDARGTVYLQISRSIPGMPTTWGEPMVVSAAHELPPLSPITPP